jgi:hypothetical protein
MTIKNAQEAQTKEKMCTDRLTAIFMCFSEKNEEDTKFQTWTAFMTALCVQVYLHNTVQFVTRPVSVLRTMCLPSSCID